MRVPGMDYVDYLLPGFPATGVPFAGPGTATAMADELAGGFIDRWRFQPPAQRDWAGEVRADDRSASLTGPFGSGGRSEVPRRTPRVRLGGHRLVIVLAAGSGLRWRGVAKAARRTTQKVLQMTRVEVRVPDRKR